MGVWRFFRRQYAFLFCIFLHLVIVAAHGVLIFVTLEHRQRITEDHLATDVVFMAIIMAPGAIIKVSIEP